MFSSKALLLSNFSINLSRKAKTINVLHNYNALSLYNGVAGSEPG